MLELHQSETALRPATTIVILVLLLLIAVAGIIFVVQLFAS